MKKLKIRGQTRRQLTKSSRSPIRDYFCMLRSSQSRSYWLRSSNRYRVNCVDRYSKDLKHNRVNDRELVAYIAASLPGHTIDGWAFLGRAVDSILRNDAYSAIHFAYYAELRAAMAILASEGVGIFSNRHPTVDVNGNTKLLPLQNGTHAVVWPFLDHWQSLSKSSKLMNEIFQPGGFPLEIWLSQMQIAVSAPVILGKMLNVWGFDLKLADDDHTLRNLVSYRPSQLRQPTGGTFERTLDFVKELWQCFEPSPGGAFLILESEILKRAFDLAGVPRPISQQSVSMVGVQNPYYWSQRLNSTRTGSLMHFAEAFTDVESPECHLQVAARAALLLSIATSATRRVLSDAGFSKEELSFWWQKQGNSRGLWSNEDMENPVDTWGDIEACLGDVDNAGAVANSLSEWRLGNSVAVSTLGAFELVGIWGMIP